MEPLPNPDPQARRVGALLSLMLDLFKTDVRPNISWQRRWYDRVVRVIGAVISHGHTGGNGLRRLDPQSLKGAA